MKFTKKLSLLLGATKAMKTEKDDASVKEDDNGSESKSNEQLKKPLEKDLSESSTDLDKNKDENTKLDESYSVLLKAPSIKESVGQDLPSLQEAPKRFQEASSIDNVDENETDSLKNIKSSNRLRNKSNIYQTKSFSVPEKLHDNIHGKKVIQFISNFVWIRIQCPFDPVSSLLI